MHTRLTLLILALVLSAAARAQVLEPQDGQFQVSEQTTLYNYAPSVAMSSSGDFIVIWEKEREAGTGDEPFARRYASDGSSLGAQFNVSDGFQGEDARAAMTASGEFIVVWSGDEDPGDTSFEGIGARRYGSDGQPLGAPFLLNAYTTGAQRHPDVVIDDDGAFTVVWDSNGSLGDDSSNGSIQLRRFDSAGSAIGSEIQVNTYTTSRQEIPRIARVGDGFVVAWESLGSPGDDSSGFSIQGRRLTSDGAFVGDQFQVNIEGGDDQEDPAVAGDAEGRFLVTWATYRSLLDDDIRARLYDSSGTPLGGEIEVNSITSGRQRFPAVAAGNDGHFAVVWESDETDGTDGGESVQLRTIDSGGTSLASDFQVNTYTPGTQDWQEIATDGDGRFVVTWQSYGSDTSEDEEVSVQAQRFDLLEVAGRVWLDTNIDGVQDAGEGDLAGVQVDLFDDSAMLIDSATTNGGGEYSIYPPAAGDYYVAVEQVMPYTFTLQDQGADEALDSDVDPMTGLSADFAVSGRSRLDAGQTNGLGDFVWLDEDGNGLQDAGEPGVSDVAVSLLDAGAMQVAQTITDDEGRYVFGDVAPGTYSLAFTAPPGFAFSAQDQGGDENLDSDVDSVGETMSFSFTAGTIDLDVDAGLEPAVIGNRVWLDEDTNGLQDAGEIGFGGITVRLLDAAGIEIASTTTDANGLYGFSGIAAGEYRIEVVPPTDGVFSSQDIGGNDLIDSDVDPITGRSEPFNYTADSASRNWDAGLRILPLFADGFESGDTSGWSSSVP